jgi:predicted Zn-dependent peptidase
MAFPVFGSKNNINNLGINDLKEWYQENYQPENMIFTVAGDVSIKQASSCIEKYFQIKNIGKVRKFNDLTGFNFQKKEQETIINKKRFQRDYLAIVYPVGERLGLNLVKYSLLWDLIYQKLRFEIESSSLFYDADFAYFYDLFKGDFQDTFSCNKKNTAKIKKIFSQKIESMDFSEEFFQKTKDYFVSSLETKEDSPGDLSSLSLYLLNQPEKIIKLEDEVKKIKATSFAEIKKLKSGIFNESNRYIYLMQ